MIRRLVRIVVAESIHRVADRLDPAPAAPRQAPHAPMAYDLPAGTSYDDGRRYKGWTAMDGESFVPMPGSRSTDA